MTTTTWSGGPLRYALGIEDTFVPQTRPGQRALDEYELMQHYDHWQEDLEHSAAAGASLLRWGIPWYRIQPEPHRWDWDWLDRVVDSLEELQLDLVADLVHYGTPLWLTSEFASPDYPARVAEYAAAVAERYRGRIRHYTPANEPMLNALYCGDFGHWPPYLTGDTGFVTLVRSLARGIVLTQQAIAATDPHVDFVHVEASFRFAGPPEAHAELREHLGHRAYLIQDLVTGRIDGEHPLVGYLSTNGFDDADLAWALEHTAEPDVMGVNYYPQHSTELFEEGVHLTGGPGQLRPRVNAGTDGLKDVLRSFAARYGKPVFLSETGFTGSVQQRAEWMDASVRAVLELRAEQIDVVGYTWWCTTDMFDWSYRYGTGAPMDHLLPMGLWALEEDTSGVLHRRRTPLADKFLWHTRHSG